MNFREAEQKSIDLAGHRVPVEKDGLYDRFRSNPPLSVIAEEAPEVDLSWFKTLHKEKKDVGFITWSPNYYYKNSSITGIFTADIDRLKALMPEKILEVVKPISIVPGRGLVAITAYAYHYCDNDSYKELSISIITTKPDAGNWGIISLLGEVINKDQWGYILKLPVNTELARVRGVVGYQMPKWLIRIDNEENERSVKFDIYDENGAIDFSLHGKKLEISADEPHIVRSNFVNLNANGELTHGYTDNRSQQKASSSDGSDLALTLHDGDLSKLLRSLDLGKMIRYEYEPEFQAALYTPEIITKKE